MAVPLSKAIKYLPRLLTAHFRPLPDFLLIGAAKCGTTSFFNQLILTEQVAAPAKKEIHYFDFNHKKPILWYRAFFPTALARRRLAKQFGHPILSGEASPLYVFHPAVPERVKRILPEVKIIVLLRNPVDRAYSQYRHLKRDIKLKQSFRTYYETEMTQFADDYTAAAFETKKKMIDQINNSSLRRGIYIDQIKRWHQHFPRKNMLVHKSETFFEDGQSVIQKTADFLGIRQISRFTPLHDNRGGRHSVDPSDRQRLESFFEPYNQELYDYLGEDLGW